MDSFELDESVCRICLEHNVILNWKEYMFEGSNMSYKDCYYKYTGLQDIDSDSFPSNLCQMCSNELKNAHLLLEKALESFKILQVALSVEKLKSDPYLDISVDQMEIKPQIQSSNFIISNEVSENDSPADDKTLIEIGEEIYLTNVYEKGTLPITENAVNNLNFLNTEYNTIEPGHFIDIQKYESLDGDFIKQNLIESCDLKLLKTSSSKKAVKKRKTCDPSDKTLIKENGRESYDTKLLKAMTTSKPSKQKKICESSTETSLEHEISASCDIKSPIPSTTNKTGKTRKKYLLMCAYCSLKVDGTNQLKKHEATHSEDRKRTETCPQCGIKLYTKMALNNHIKVHDENRQKKYKCEFCEKAFFNRGALNVHRRIHLGLMVTCRICLKEFYRQIDLDKHLLKHSVSPLQKNVEKLKYTVQCQYCNKYIPTNKWREHKAAHLDQPQMKCKICDKNFFARSKCVSHLQRLHKKKKGYEESIHYYVNCNTRMSHLMIKQQEVVKPLTPTHAE